MITEEKKLNGKKLRSVKEKINTDTKYSITDAIKFLQENKVAKFNETLEVVVKLGVNPANSDQMVRGVVDMPSGTGKKIRVAVITSDKNEEKAKKAGADIVGLESVIDDIKAKKIDFDICIATPDVMPKISAIARILGPKGLMPNPKLGTVTMDVEKAVKQAKAGQVEFRTEKAGIIHAGIGKLSFTLDELIANVSALFEVLIKARPSGAKGAYLKEVFVASTMGPSLKVDVTSIVNKG
jgi:large subunit ribosomal protein L1